ncbi:MAG: amidohydrolase [Thaumarchaeota archaeon]|nr:amidohydrolase [Nitrososphaerota archaeon]
MTGVLIENCTLLHRGVGSVYVADGRVIKVMTDGIPAIPESTVRLDANGSSLLPGLIDTHCHPFGYGWLKRNIDLRGTTNITGLRLRLQARVLRTSPGEWVTGMGWDNESFPGGRMPTRSEIDDLSPRNPVALSRVCGHIVLLNSIAVELLGLSSAQGPEYERDTAGVLTGIVKEGALGAVFSAFPRSVQLSSNDLLAVEVEAMRFGLTTLHCILSPEGYQEELEALQTLHSADSLSLRYRIYLPPEAMKYVEEHRLRQRLGDDRVRINGIKIYADGSMGARTAALREPYADDPGNTGLLRHSDSELQGLVDSADGKGYQVIVHAIGDRAIEQAIDAISHVTGSKNERRHRIEHASLLPRDLRNKMAKYRIRATVQPSFITSDAWAVDRLGEERVRDLYPLKSMLNEGIIASGSSDAPIESLSPVIGVWAAMVRMGSAPEESLTLDECLGLYTTNAASNGFDEMVRLEEGSQADFTLLDSDITGMHPALLRKVGVSATMVGGTLVHSTLGE